MDLLVDFVVVDFVVVDLRVLLDEARADLPGLFAADFLALAREEEARAEAFGLSSLVFLEAMRPFWATATAV